MAAPTTSTPLLTAARQGLWNAIDNWPALASVFARKFRCEDKGQTQGAVPEPTSTMDLPAIAIYPASGDSPWITNAQQELTYALTLSIWTETWSLLAIERLYEQIVIAIQRSKDANGLEYWRASTGPGAAIVSKLTIGQFAAAAQPVGENGPVASRWDLPVVLGIRWAPRGD